MILNRTVVKLIVLGALFGSAGCMRSIGTARLGLDDVIVAERGFTIDGLYQFELVPKVRNTGVVTADAKLIVSCKVQESEEKEKKSDAFFMNLDAGQSKNGRPILFTSRTANPGTRISYKCFLQPNDNATKPMTSGNAFDADFEVTGASGS